MLISKLLITLIATFCGTTFMPIFDKSIPYNADFQRLNNWASKITVEDQLKKKTITNRRGQKKFSVIKVIAIQLKCLIGRVAN